MFSGDDILAIRRKDRIVHDAVLFLGDLLWVATLRADDPDVVGPTPVRGDSDAFAIGAIGRLDIPCRSTCEPVCLPAGYGHGINIAQEIKYDRFAIGRYVEAHPGAFIRIKFQFRGGTMAGGNIPLFFLVLGRRRITFGVAFLLRRVRLGADHVEGKRNKKQRSFDQIHESVSVVIF